jgi:polyhydroxyalkanoate synthesis regulator phasin
MSRRGTFVAVAVAVAVAGAGGALAAQRLDTPKQRSQAIIDDAAGQLGIDPSKLSGALKRAIENQIDQAVKDGRLTEAQGKELKQRVEAGDSPLLGFGLGFPGVRGFLGPPGTSRLALGADFDAAATYLGLTDAQLRTQLQSGKTLAQIAKDQSKSVDGLVDALVAATKQQLDAAVSAGRLTQDQAARIESNLKQRMTDRVNGVRPSFGPAGGAPFFRGSALPRGPRSFWRSGGGRHLIWPLPPPA